MWPYICRFMQCEETLQLETLQSLFIININIAGPGVGPSLCTNFFSLPSSLHEFFFLAFSLAWIFFWLFPHPSHHFSNGPSLKRWNFFCQFVTSRDILKILYPISLCHSLCRSRSNNRTSSERRDAHIATTIICIWVCRKRARVIKR